MYFVGKMYFSTPSSLSDPNISHCKYKTIKRLKNTIKNKRNNLLSRRREAGRDGKCRKLKSKKLSF